MLTIYPNLANQVVMIKTKSVNRNRIVLLVTGVLIAIFIASQAEHLDKRNIDESVNQKVNPTAMFVLIPLPGILLQSGRYIKEIIRIIAP